MASPASSIVMSPTAFSAPTMADSDHPFMEWLHKDLPAEFCTGVEVFHKDDFPVGQRLKTQVLRSVSTEGNTPGSPMSVSSSVGSLPSTSDRSPTHMAEISIIPRGEQNPRSKDDTRVLPVYLPIIREGSEKKIDGKSVFKLKQRDVTVETANLRYHALELPDDEKLGVKGMKLPQQGAIRIKLWKIFGGLNIGKDKPYVTVHYQFSLQKMAQGSTSVIREFLFVPPAYVDSTSEPARPNLWGVMQAGVAKGQIRTQADVLADGIPNRPEGFFSGHGLRIMFGVREDNESTWVSNPKPKVVLHFDHAHDRSPHMIDNLNFMKASDAIFALRDWATDGNPTRKADQEIKFTIDIVLAASMKEHPHNPEKWELADLKKQPPNGDLWVRRVLVLYEGKSPQHSFKTKEQLEAEKKKAAQSNSNDNKEEDPESQKELEGGELEAALAGAMRKLVKSGSQVMTFPPSRPFKAIFKHKQEKPNQTAPYPFMNGTAHHQMYRPNGRATPPGYLPYGLPSPVSPSPYNGGQFQVFPGMQLPGAPIQPHFPGINPAMQGYGPAPPDFSNAPLGYSVYYVPHTHVMAQNGAQPGGHYIGEVSSDSGRSAAGSRAPTNGVQQPNRRNSNPRGANAGNGPSHGNQKRQQSGSPSGPERKKSMQFNGPPSGPQRKKSTQFNNRPSGPERKKSMQFDPPRRTATAPAKSQKGWSKNVPDDARQAKSAKLRQIRRATSWRTEPETSPTTPDSDTEPETSPATPESDAKPKAEQTTRDPVIDSESDSEGEEKEEEEEEEEEEVSDSDSD